jgi:hypothetical protein
VSARVPMSNGAPPEQWSATPSVVARMAGGGSIGRGDRRDGAPVVVADLEVGAGGQSGETPPPDTWTQLVQRTVSGVGDSI